MKGNQEGQGDGAEGVTWPLALKMEGPCAEKCGRPVEAGKGEKMDFPVSTKKCSPTDRT